MSIWTEILEGRVHILLAISVIGTYNPFSRLYVSYYFTSFVGQESVRLFTPLLSCLWVNCCFHGLWRFQTCQYRDPSPSGAITTCYTSLYSRIYNCIIYSTAPSEKDYNVTSSTEGNGYTDPLENTGTLSSPVPSLSPENTFISTNKKCLAFFLLLKELLNMLKRNSFFFFPETAPYLSVG